MASNMTECKDRVQVQESVLTIDTENRMLSVEDVVHDMPNAKCGG